MKIACVGAHPDDVELSMGGAILLLRDLGHEILIIDLTDGEPTPFGSPEIRREESKLAARKMGVDRITLSNPNRFLLDTIESRKMLAGVFRDFQPEIIFTHFEFDIHPDHGSACAITEASRFYSKLTKSDISGEPFFPSRIIYYFPNHIHINLLPSFCIDISSYVEKKKAVLECYDSQFLKKGNGIVIQKAIEVNRYFGIRIEKAFAEPFYLRDSLDLNFYSKLLQNQKG
jgi:N-acetylglucosamine malate deacetylase 1